MVPLVAFDHRLNRIGYGKGYYDRNLEKINKLKKKIISLGIAYSFQKCKDIPVNKHDFKLDYIFTERGIISSNK
jgi:5-formyltetrahydrofolate cyclo-ligase